ncbi:MAG: flagellar M-ring protein FliF [Nitriliruptoraceae bacterium]|jgi:flagellar M-ring protein FliF
MDDARDRFSRYFVALPIAHRVTVIAAAIGLVMAAIVFGSWVTRPEMTVLANGLDGTSLSSVIDDLEASNTPYQIGGGGTTVMIPRDLLYTTRARLASSGIAAGDTAEGWEILDSQGIAISDFQQQTNYQRALEGELSRTLMAMAGIDAATVHLVLPEDRLFTEQQEARSAAVLLDTGRTLDADEIEAVVFLVSSAVEGLETGGVTVADAKGSVLHAPGDSGGSTTGASKQLRETREYETSLAADIQRLLTTATGSAASVVVRASLDFDSTQTAVRTFDPDSQVAMSEQLIDETYEGTGAVDAGIVGIDGGPIEGATGDATNYNRSEVLREFGISETTTTTTQAPGRIDGLSVAIVMDDGSISGATVPSEDDVSSLVAAAVGLDVNRGDSIAVTRVAFPAADVADGDAADAPMDVSALAGQVGAVVVLIIVALALLLMSRRRDKGAKKKDGGDAEMSSELVARQDATLGAIQASTPVDGAERVLSANAKQVDAIADGARLTPPVRAAMPDGTARREVEELVDKQPEEIANLLRGWLADAN